MPDTPCELCDDPTPARLLQRDGDRGWDDGLCPGCWMLNQPAEAASLQTPTEALPDASSLTHYAMAWQARQQAALGAGLLGSRQPAHARWFGGIQGLFG